MTFTRTFQRFRNGQIDRRTFLTNAFAAGMLPNVAWYAAHAAQTPQATPAHPNASGGGARGSAGDVKILQWQAPTALGQHTAQGGKDNLAASLIFEPLTNYLADGTLIPNLITEIPSVENGLLAGDRSSVTYKLLPDVVWSDGTPLTANDVQFTWQWVTNTDNGATTFETYSTIKDVTVEDDLTVTLSFGEPQPAWFVPFAGSWWGAVYPKHLLDGKSADEYAAFLNKPVGTGPYVVESFTPGDQVAYVANESFRIPNRPLFARVTLKGGGDAAGAARAVLQSGEFDLAWNMQVEPETLTEMESAGLGKVVTYPGASLEQIYINFADPHTEVDGEMSSLSRPHPFLTDAAVRQAMGTAIDRDKIATTFYGEGEPASANVLVGIPAMESPNTSFTFDPAAANSILDDAGYAQEGDVRAKDGMELKLTYNTTVNPVRQKTQAVVKQGLEAIGFAVEIKQTDSSIYFDSSAGNTQSYIHFYDDLGMSTANIDSPFPLAYMNRWYSGKDNANVPQKSNNWGGQDLQRYVNEEYNALFEQATTEVDAAKSAELFIQMNDILVNDQVVIPLVQRAAEKLAISNRLKQDAIACGPFETAYWNIANWTTSE